LLGLPKVERTSIMTKATKLRIKDFKIGFFVGILSKNRSKKKLTKHPIIRPPTKASTRANGREEIEKAAIYSAEIGDRIIAKSTTQKAAPPATVNLISFLENSCDVWCLVRSVAGGSMVV
jgi:hypothetical protein